MNFNKVNYKVIQDCFEGCESKEAIFDIFSAAASCTLDSEIKVLKADALPSTLRNLPQTLGITNEKALVLILSLHALAKEYISLQDEEAIAERFPEDFPKKIKSFLFKMMRAVSESSKGYYQDQFTALPKLRDFDWRMDVKISSKQEDRLKQPTLYVKMDLERDTQNTAGSSEQQVLFQVSKGQLGQILNNFEAINKQLSQMSQQ
jgi:hypothetical protein